MREDHYEIWQDHRREYRWRFKASNGETMSSGEGYVNRLDCERAVLKLKASSAAPVRYLPPLAPKNALMTARNIFDAPSENALTRPMTGLGRGMMGSSRRNALNEALRNFSGE